MRLLEGLAELLAPTRCAGCELPGALLCSRCETARGALRRRADVPVVRRTARRARLHGVLGARVRVRASTRAWRACDAARREPSCCTRTPGSGGSAPTSGRCSPGESLHRGRAGQTSSRGYRPRRRPVSVAGSTTRRGWQRPSAGALGVPALRLLDRAAARDQRALDRTQRAANAAATFSAIGEIPGRVIIVDDVFTTGATLDAAASALLEAGADDGARRGHRAGLVATARPASSHPALLESACFRPGLWLRALRRPSPR